MEDREGREEDRVVGELRTALLVGGLASGPGSASVSLTPSSASGYSVRSEEAMLSRRSMVKRSENARSKPSSCSRGRCPRAR